MALLQLLRTASPEGVFAGFSFGATLGALAAAQRPDLVAALVAVGMDIDGGAAGASAYDFALAVGPSVATRAPSGSWSGSVRPHTCRQAVLHPGPLGLQLRWCHHERDLRRVARD